MRGVEAPPAGRVTAVGAEGVVFTSESGVPATKGAKAAEITTVVSWDRVAGVEGDLASDAAAFMDAAQKLWRARTRLDRGDIVGAEPLFEEVFPTYGGKQGPTAAVAAGGLLRCRLGLGAQTAAVAPWLAYLNAVGDTGSLSLPSADPDPTAPAAVEGAGGLSPALPPIWVNLPAVQSLARSDWKLAGLSGRAAVLGAYYEQAARFEAGLPATTPGADIEHDDAVALVREVVVSRIGDDARRAAARQALTARLRKHPPAWKEAWIHAAVGRSMLLESDTETQLLGVAELAELPSHLERVNPYLTGIALAEAAVATAKLGDVAGAARLRNDLADRFPGHPALEWEPLRAIPAAAPAAGNPSGNSVPPNAAPAANPAPTDDSTPDSNHGGST